MIKVEYVNDTKVKGEEMKEKAKGCILKVISKFNIILPVISLGISPEN